MQQAEDNARREPLTEMERAIILPELEEWRRLQQRLVECQERLSRMGAALRPGAKLDVQDNSWIFPEEQPAKGPEPGS
jgi:hypothetical protein